MSVEKITHRLAPWLLPVLLLAIWQLAVSAGWLSTRILPAPSAVIEAGVTLVRSGEIDLVYVAPERLMTQRCLDLFADSRIALFAIDEAHCVSSWGHDFRPDYLALAMLHDHWPDVPRIALTATATAATAAEIVSRLRLDDAAQFVASFDRPNIEYRIVGKDNPRAQLLTLLRTEHAGDAGIVYCLSRKSVEQTAELLQK